MVKGVRSHTDYVILIQALKKTQAAKKLKDIQNSRPISTKNFFLDSKLNNFEPKLFISELYTNFYLVKNCTL